jgi:hypothetical protein
MEAVVSEAREAHASELRWAMDEARASCMASWRVAPNLATPTTTSAPDPLSSTLANVRQHRPLLQPHPLIKKTQQSKSGNDILFSSCIPRH